MTALVRVAVAVLAGAAGGYFSAQKVIADGVDGWFTINNGPWKAWTSAGTPDSDPYTKAHFALRGEIPLSRFEAISYQTSTDSEGSPIRLDCLYEIEGQLLASRTWSLSLIDEDAIGTPPKGTNLRRSFNADNIVRNTDGSFTVILSPTTRPGNWLPLQGISTAALELTIISPLEGARADPATFPVPLITKGACS